MGRIPDSGTLPVDVGGWLDDLVKLSLRNDEGHTAEELAAAAGCCKATMLLKLARVRDLGRLVIGKRTKARIDGMKFQQTVYRVLALPKKSKGRGR